MKTKFLSTALLLAASLVLAAPAMAQSNPGQKSPKPDPFELDCSKLADLAKLGDLSKLGVDLAQLGDVSRLASEIAESVAHAELDAVAPLADLGQLHALPHSRDFARLRALSRQQAPRSDHRDRRRSGPEQTERFTKSFRVGASGSLDLSNISGDIVVKAGPGDDIVVDAIKRTPQGPEAKNELAAVAVEATEHAGRVEVNTRYPERTRHMHTAVDYTVTVPAGASVNLQSISGDIKVTGVKGLVRISECISGDVVLEDAPQIESIRSVSGDVTVTRAAGADVRITGVNGDLTLRNVKMRSLDATTVSGDVKLDDVTTERATIKTMSGDVDFVGPFARSGRYEFTAHSGEVRLTPTSNTGFEIDADTFSGEIRANMPITLKQGELPQGRHMVRHEMRGTYGDGSAMVTVRTFSGGVTIGKKAQ